MSDRDLLLQITERMVRQETKLDDLLHDLRGNGKPGVIEDFRSIKNSHEACLKRQTEDKNAAAIERKRTEKRFLTAATIGCGVVGALTPYIIRGIIFFLSLFAPINTNAAEVALLPEWSYSIYNNSSSTRQ